jgi:phospholipase/carboxylesterase
MWPFTRAFKELNPIVIAAQAPTPDPLGGFSWWEVHSNEHGSMKASTKEDFLVPINGVLDFLTKASSIYGFELKKINLMGFSQGAAVSASLYSLHPEYFSSCAMLAGFLPKLLVQDLKERRPNLEQHKFVIAHGTKDETIPVDRAREGAELLKELGAQVSYVEDDVGHKIGSQAIKTLTEFYLSQG